MSRPHVATAAELRRCATSSCWRGRRSRACGRGCTGARSTATARSSASTGTTGPATICGTWTGRRSRAPIASTRGSSARRRTCRRCSCWTCRGRWTYGGEVRAGAARGRRAGHAGAGSGRRRGAARRRRARSTICRRGAAIGISRCSCACSPSWRPRAPRRSRPAWRAPGVMLTRRGPGDRGVGFLRRRGLVALRRLARMGHEVVVVQTLDAEELDAPELGAVEFVDAETGRTVVVQSETAAAPALRERVRAWLSGLEARHSAARASTTCASPPATSLERALRRYLVSRSGRRLSGGHLPAADGPGWRPSPSPCRSRSTC